MARTTVDVQLTKIRKQVEALQAKEKALLSKANDKVVARIVALANKHNVTVEALGKAMDTAKKKRKARGTRHKTPAPRKSANKSDKRAKVAPKYRNPNDAAQTWTGRGKSPVWVHALMDAGTLETALIAAQ